MKKSLFALYLGGALGFANISFTNWQFWVIIVPTIILVAIFNDGKEK